MKIKLASLLIFMLLTVANATDVAGTVNKIKIGDWYITVQLNVNGTTPTNYALNTSSTVPSYKDLLAVLLAAKTNGNSVSCYLDGTTCGQSLPCIKTVEILP